MVSKSGLGLAVIAVLESLLVNAEDAPFEKCHCITPGRDYNQDPFAWDITRQTCERAGGYPRDEYPPQCIVYIEDKTFFTNQCNASGINIECEPSGPPYCYRQQRYLRSKQKHCN